MGLHLTPLFMGGATCDQLVTAAGKGFDDVLRAPNKLLYSVVDSLVNSAAHWTRGYFSTSFCIPQMTAGERLIQPGVEHGFAAHFVCISISQHP